MGEAGIGKSRLVEEMAAGLDQSDLVLAGHGVELETGELPYGVLAESLRALVRQIGVEALLALVEPTSASIWLRSFPH